MSRRFVRACVAWLPVLGLLAVVVATTGTSQAQRAGSLSVSPNVYVAGQDMTFTGSLGRSGRQRIFLQFNMNRPGDQWTRVDGFRGYTDSSGHFKFHHPAPAMFGISYRVASAGTATPGFLFRAKTQEIFLSVEPGNEDLPADTVVAGEPFTVSIDTTPNISGRTDLPPPAFPGRVVALQKRVNGDQWETVATGQTNDNGVEQLQATVDDSGDAVFRVRQDDWTQGRNQIGWFPSFPYYVHVVRRPEPVQALAVTATDDSSITLGWTQPVDPDVAKTVVAWRQGGTPPTSPDDADDWAVIGPAATSYVVDLLPADTQHAFTVFTRNADFLLSSGESVVDSTEPPPPDGAARTARTGVRR